MVLVLFLFLDFAATWPGLGWKSGSSGSESFSGEGHVGRSGELWEQGGISLSGILGYREGNIFYLIHSQ